MKVFYATSNPGKVQEVSRFLQPAGVAIVTPKDLGIEQDVPETGSSLLENAMLKARAYASIVTDMPVLADDTGVEIAALDGEPGIYVRRWRDRQSHMTDQEIIDYCIERMSDVPPGERQARFHTVMFLIEPDGTETSFDGYLDGEIVEEPMDLQIEGFPFESLLYIPEYTMMLGEMHQIPVADRGRYLSHREKAAQLVTEYFAAS